MALGVMDFKEQPLDNEKRSSVSQVRVETLGTEHLKNMILIRNVKYT